MTPLSPETVRVLRAHRVAQPMFSNQIMADLFEQDHTRGRFKVLPGTDGKYTAFETGRPLGQGNRGRYATSGEALKAIELLAKAAT